MALANDLLAQAHRLLGSELEQPNQADLRRAVSAAYYALFHRLIADAVQTIGPRRPTHLPARIARAFSHSEMKQVCRSISERRVSLVLRGLQPSGFSPAVIAVVRYFAELQDERQRTDYDLLAVYTRVEALEIVDAAEKAFREWEEVREQDEANVFLSALLFAGRWSK